MTSDLKTDKFRFRHFGSNFIRISYVHNLRINLAPFSNGIPSNCSKLSSSKDGILSNSLACNHCEGFRFCCWFFWVGVAKAPATTKATRHKTPNGFMMSLLFLSSGNTQCSVIDLDRVLLLPFVQNVELCLSPRPRQLLYPAARRCRLRHQNLKSGESVDFQNNKQIFLLISLICSKSFDWKLISISLFLQYGQKKRDCKFAAICNKMHTILQN